MASGKFWTAGLASWPRHRRRLRLGQILRQQPPKPPRCRSLGPQEWPLRVATMLWGTMGHLAQKTLSLGWFWLRVVAARMCFVLTVYITDTLPSFKESMALRSAPSHQSTAARTGDGKEGSASEASVLISRVRLLQRELDVYSPRSAGKPASCLHVRRRRGVRGASMICTRPRQNASLSSSPHRPDLCCCSSAMYIHD
ncbi:hypothetical protein GQ53DRAFT_158403 [Thozetella sp. PMI_491]|nr:hypothetical protein GQ53DRAFT_158403 [Thozetella sp. PMI_491]